MKEQLRLPIVPIKHQEDESGFEMGVMSDGTPYLTASGLAYLCGVARSVIITLVKDWDEDRSNPRDLAISELIGKYRGDKSSLYRPIVVKGTTYHAIPADSVCMAVLEYYAFETRNPSELARQNFRDLASQSLRELIYQRTGYKAAGVLPSHLSRYIKNREKIPYTHFSMLNEITLSLIAPLEEAGYTLPDNLVPDISEGRLFCAWLRKHKGVEPKGFPRYQHEYNDGRVVDACLYPIELMEDFRRHFHEIWLREKAPDYFKQRDTQALVFIENLALPSPK
ncbi:hypothetical protein [Aeromonas salmonicida]|uniref:hypothetical protein n=1 Tax=Aeromonas salmonicida TaxID=645 RepID=UPI0031FC81BA